MTMIRFLRKEIDVLLSGIGEMPAEMEAEEPEAERPEQAVFEDGMFSQEAAALWSKAEAPMAPEPKKKRAMFSKGDGRQRVVPDKKAKESEQITVEALLPGLAVQEQQVENYYDYILAGPEEAGRGKLQRVGDLRSSFIFALPVLILVLVLPVLRFGLCFFRRIRLGK